MRSFPEVEIIADRLDIREFGSRDADLVGEVLSAGEAEALPPGAPSQPDELAGWLAEGVHQVRRSGGGVHLMMLAGDLGGPVTSDPSTSSAADASILEQQTKLWEKA